MSFMKWLYKVATGRTLGKTKELKLRYEKAEAQQTRADNKVKVSCMARDIAQEQHVEAVSEYNKAVKKRTARVPSRLDIKPIREML